MSKRFWIIAILFTLGIACSYYWVVVYSPKVHTQEDVILEKMELLNNKVDSIKRANDSIKVIIDTTEIEIEHVYEKYIQVREHIINQSVDSDCVFFSNYLSNDSKRFIDTINFIPAETH